MRYLNKKGKFHLFPLVLFLVLIFVFINLDYHYRTDHLIDEKTPKLKKADYWNLTGSNIIIDENDPLRNWVITAATYDWCSGSGTWSDPFLIENITIDGQNSESFNIRILNSEVYFIIRNCTLFNTGLGGIRLDYVNNGKIINNTCAFNQIGIELAYSTDNSIEDNLISNNGFIGIVISRSDNNLVQNNVISYNGELDVQLHRYGGIRISVSEANIVKKNIIYNNTHNGIYFAERSDNNYITMNSIHNNSYGVKMHTQLCDSNHFLKNNISHGDYGIYLRSSTSSISNQNNIFSENYVIDNNLYGIFILNSQKNLIYLNNFSRNSINAYDDGSENKWDYGKVGNYWDDYDGIDANDDGIGDTPYNIPGSAQNKDYYPVLDFDKVTFYFGDPIYDPIPILIFSIVIFFVFIFILSILIFRKKIAKSKLFYLKKRKSLQRKKQIRIKENKLEANKFHNLLIKSKNLIDKGDQFYSKNSFISAIDNWKIAIVNYELALKKAPSSKEKEEIRKTLKIVKENICKAYFSDGKDHISIAEKRYNREKFEQAEKEWSSAKQKFQIAIEQINSENLDIDYESYINILKNIELKLSQIKIEKLVLEADNTLEKAKSLEEEDLSEAIKLTVDAISIYFKVKKTSEKDPNFRDLLVKIQKKIKKASNFQSNLQNKMISLLEVKPIPIRSLTKNFIETKSYECPFCGELISSDLVQEYKANNWVKCKFCGVNIPKNELI